MTININAANITSIRLAEQSSAPSTPASGFASLFVDTNGDLATRKDAGGIKIATSPATGDYIFTIDGTGTAARLNASNVFTSAQVLPAGTVGAPALTTTGDTNTGIYFPAADTIGFSTGGTIRGRWTTDGLCFGSDTAAANALDDYEEGTWTISIQFGGAAAGVTYSINTGAYTKVGRQVTVTGRLTLTSKGSSTGNVLITGLPFTIQNADAAYPAFALGAVSSITFADFIQSFGIINTTTIRFDETTNAGVRTTLTNADFANDSSVIISGSYFI